MLDFEDPNQLVGAILDGRFRLSRVIGQGGLGVVYEAESLDGTGPRAIKLLRAEFCDSEEIVSRFLSEVQASARVDHPGVAKVFEAVRAADGTPYLVMELLVGQPLANRMNKGRVPVEQAAAIVRNILLALEVAHAAGVIHRDLKPGNVFLVGDPVHGSDTRLLDFGISLVIDAAGGMQRKTRTGMLLGTPGYMSPEQIRDVKHADLRADLWSTGIIFLELLSGQPAFEAENEFVRVTKVLTSEPIAIENVAPQFAHWGPFFRRAVARDPGQRFQSAREMLAALDAVARDGQMPAPATANSPGQAAAAQPGQYPSVPPPGHYASAPPGHYPSVPPNPSAQGSTPMGGAYGSVPPAPYGSVPPPSPAVAQHGPGAPRRFGGDTAVSAGVPGAGVTGPVPSVEVVSVPRRGVPLPLIAMLVAIALLLGFTLGFVVGRL